MKKIVIFSIIAGFSTALLVFQPPFLTDITKIFQKSDSSLLNNVILENLEIDGKKYSFTEGKIESGDNHLPTSAEKAKVTRLVFFYQWVKEDPLFTAPNFDIGGFENSLKLLKSQSDLQQKIINRQENLFPLSLLDLLPEVFRKEEIFLKNPSRENAQDLIEAYRTTASAYTTEVAGYLQSLHNHQDVIGHRRFVFINTYTTEEVIFADLEKIQKNGHKLEEEIADRKICLEQGRNCQRPSSSWERPDLRVEKNTDLKILPFDILFPLLTANDLKSVRGPYIINSPCWGWGENFDFPPQPFYVTEITKEALKNNSGQKTAIFSPKLATTNYYRPLLDSPGFPLERKAKEAGYQWVWQPETNNYLCTNLEYQPKLATLDYFWQNFRDNPLLAGNPPQNFSPEATSFWQDGQNFEKDFFRLKIPDGDSLQKLAQTYAFFYRFWPKNDPETKDALLKRKLLIERNLANFPLIMNKSIYHFTRAILQQELVPELTRSEKYFYLYVYLYRNPWQILYFPFSSSFWRLEDKLDYLEKGKVEISGTQEALYFTYQDAVKKFSGDEIKKLHWVTQNFLGENPSF